MESREPRSSFDAPKLVYDASNTATSLAAASPTEEPFEAAEELDLANKIFSKEKFGELEGKPVWPFTWQLKHDIEAHFSIDRGAFAETNKLQRSIFFGYIGLRTLTLATFVVWLWIVVSAVLRYEGVAKPNVDTWLPKSTNDFIAESLSKGIKFVEMIHKDMDRISEMGVILFLILISALAMSLIRITFRGIYFYLVGNIVDKWASMVILAHANIVNRITSCCNRVITRPKEGPRGWPMMAKNWTKIALFNAKRVEYLDRHATTTLWKIDRNLFETELSFRTAKVVLVALALWIVWSNQSAPAPQESVESWEKFLTFAGGSLDLLLLSAILTLLSYLVWDHLHRQSNDLWREKLVELFNREKIEKTHYFDQLGDVVGGIVASLIAQDQNLGGLVINRS